VSAQLAAALPPDVALEPPSPAIGFVHRRLRDADLYFLANTSSTGRIVRARFGSQAASTESWNPMTGLVQRIELSGGLATLTFEPYGSRVIVFRTSTSAAPPAPARRAIDMVELRSGWTFTRAEESASTPVDLPHSWADLARTRFFSGTAIYRRTTQVPPALRVAGARVWLDFGDASAVDRQALPGGTMRGNSFAALLAPPIREAATVFVNGGRAGAIWAPPYRIDVTDLLRNGSNDIRVDVYNTAINQLAEGGRLPDVAAVTERYGQRFHLQDVDSFQPIPSGILSVPRLVAER